MKGIRLQNATTNKELVTNLTAHIKLYYKNAVMVFQPIYIITPNQAQYQWLKEQLAEELGFIANLQHHSLNSFFRELISHLDPGTKENPGKEKLIWKLFSEMGKEEFRGKFEKIDNYCGVDEIKRLALAQKVANLFEKYQQYDPAGDWKQKTHPDAEWQMSLYDTTGYADSQLTPTQFEKLVKGNPNVLKQYHSLYLFGNLQLSPLHLEYLKILKEAEGFQLYIYRTHLNFTAERNPLAQSWGVYPAYTNDQINQLGSPVDSPDLHSGNTKLQQIQSDILSDRNSEKLPEDNSILIYNSFTKVREVEALYNYLVKAVDECDGDEKLGARDIMVCMPNLDPYISAIRTVFDSAPYKFPYTLVTQGYGREEGFWSALEQVLAFEKEDFTAPGVFNLLEMHAIQNSFGFKDLDLLKKAFIDANIRREYEGDEELETHYSSFSNGLQRLIYGFCLGLNEAVTINGRKIYPVDIAEGQQAQDLFRLHHLVELLNTLLETKQQKCSAKEWHKVLMKISEDFLSPEDWQQQQFRDLLEELGALQASGDELIAFNTFFYRLKDQLGNKDLQQIKGKGGIVFSGLYPGMSMPKKVVAFLGMNFEEFPRKTQSLSFDLISKADYPSNGDLDRGAFLQVFLNAEKKVLLSYIGQNVKDNSEIPASSIINELLDYAEKKICKIKEVKHALHAYNSKYFEEKEKDYFTYLIGSDSKIELDKEAMEPLKKPENIHLFSLESFLKDPFKHYYHKVLGVYYQDDLNLPDWEMFQPDNLEKWKIKYSVLEQSLIATLSADDQRKFLLNNSNIPLKTPGHILVEESQRKVDLLLEKLQEISSEEISEIEFDLPFYLEETGNHILKCTVSILGGQGLYLSVSKVKAKYKLAAYLRYLTLVASGKADTLNYIHLQKDEEQAIIISYSGLVTQEKARQTLRDWLSLYLKNFEKIQPYSPEFDFAIEDVDVELEELRNNINEKFDSYQGFYPSEYLSTEYWDGFFDDDNHLEDFKTNFKIIMEQVELANPK